MTRRVLLIDDDPAIRLIGRASLEHTTGWEVSEAGGGAEGVALAVAEPPDVILLDQHMPGLDGSATLARLREEEATRDVPVIMLTASFHRPGASPWDGQQVAGVVSKPFDPQRLAQDVCETLGWEL